MNTIFNPNYTLRWLSQSLGICGNAGVLVGMIAGGILSLHDAVMDGTPNLTNTEIITIGVLLALLGWLVLLFIFGALAGFTMSSIALPTLFNSLIVSLLTTYLANATGLMAFAWLIGILVGLIVGYSLCAIVRLLLANRLENHGMY